MSIIAVSGVIGAGKTTFIKKVSQSLGLPAYYENVDDNQILPLMYEDQPRWALTLQLNFLREKYDIMMEASKDESCLVERTIYEDIIFTRNHQESGNLTDIEFSMYESMYDHFTELSPIPDLMIFLDVPDELALERIRLRGRPYEQDESLIPYYIRMNELYREFVENYPYKKLIIDNAMFDYINNEDHHQQMVTLLSSIIDDEEVAI